MEDFSRDLWWLITDNYGDCSKKLDPFIVRDKKLSSVKLSSFLVTIAVKMFYDIVTGCFLCDERDDSTATPGVGQRVTDDEGVFDGSKLFEKRHQVLLREWRGWNISNKHFSFFHFLLWFVVVEKEWYLSLKWNSNWYDMKQDAFIS